jgi:hypothetical protein
MSGCNLSAIRAAVNQATNCACPRFAAELCLSTIALSTIAAVHDSPLNCACPRSPRIVPVHDRSELCLSTIGATGLLSAFGK